MRSFRSSKSAPSFPTRVWRKRIGPRPTLRYQVERYDERQRQRLAVRPGLTGWAQIHGRAELPWADRIELDVWYVENWTFALDLRILAETVSRVFGGRGVFASDGATAEVYRPAAGTTAAARD